MKPAFAFENQFPEETPENYKVPLIQEYGTTGLKRYAGRVFEEIDFRLYGSRAVRTYLEMYRNDAIISGIITSLKTIIVNAKWSVKPASDSKRAINNAIFVEECMDDMSSSWIHTMMEIASLLEYGFSMAEICYKYRKGHKKDNDKSSKYNDGKIGWAKLPIRSQESLVDGRWFFTNSGEITGVQQWAPPYWQRVDIPWEKMLLFRTTMNKNDPLGVSLLRGCYRAYYFKKQIENIEAIGIERDLAGIPVIHAPMELFQTNLTEGQKALRDSLENIVRNIKNDEQVGVLMPNQFDVNGNPRFKLELLASAGPKQMNTSQAIQRYSSDIAMSMMSDFILLGNTSRGTQALAKEKIELFMLAIQAHLDNLASTFNQWAIPRLMRVNGINSEFPTLIAKNVIGRDVTDLVTNLRNLAAAGNGMASDPGVDDVVRRNLGLPERMPLQEGTQMSSPAGSSNPKVSESRQQGEQSAGGDGAQALDKPELKRPKRSTSGNRGEIFGNKAVSSGVRQEQVPLFNPAVMNPNKPNVDNSASAKTGVKQIGERKKPSVAGTTPNNEVSDS